jgi:diadenylate cyclase
VGFVVSSVGIVLSACRYLDAVAAEVDVPLGLGSRHIAAANMSAVTKAVGVVVSESSVVRLSVMDNWLVKSFPRFG